MAGYYGILIDNDIGYGALALGAAVDGDSGAAWADFGGVFANNFLEAAFFSKFYREMLESEKQGVREGLITADYALRSSGSGEVDNNAIRYYHHKVFEDMGIPRPAWTGTFFDENLGAWSWCWDCSDSEIAGETFGQMFSDLVSNLDADLGATLWDAAEGMADFGGFVADTTMGNVLSETLAEWGEAQAQNLGDTTFVDTGSPLLLGWRAAQ